MAAPQGGYPPQEGYAQPGYVSPNLTQQQQPAVPPQGAPPTGAAAKKKRTYAGEAFEFGSGANAALGGQPTAGGAYGAYPQQPQAAGYQQPTYGADPTQMQPAAAGYAPPSDGVTQMTQQFGGMGMSEPHHMPPPQPQPVVQPQRNVQLNQLYPTDLISQPFNVAELDYPPPPIILPPQVRRGAPVYAFQVRASPKLTDNPADQRFRVSHRQLPSQIYAVYVECRPHE